MLPGKIDTDTCVVVEQVVAPVARHPVPACDSPPITANHAKATRAKRSFFIVFVIGLIKY
jgi:hypothetical protein